MENFIFFAKFWQFTGQPGLPPKATSYTFSGIKWTPEKFPVGIYPKYLVQPLKEDHDRLLSCTKHVKDTISYFDFHLKVEAAKQFCQVLPDPFLVIPYKTTAGAIENGKVFNGETTHHWRLPLKELIASLDIDKESVMVSQQALPPILGKDRLIFQIALCWSEPAKNPNNILPMAFTPEKLSPVGFMEGLFHRDASKDCVIATRSGSQVKCHMFILEAHAKMLQVIISRNGMKTTQTERVEMKDISEDGLSHFVQYLYCRDWRTQRISCKTAVELLQLAYQYRLIHFQGSLYKLFMQERLCWFAPDNILELYFCSRHMEGFENLRDHSLGIMTRMGIETLRSSEGFKKLDEDESSYLLDIIVRMK